jgi:transcriptional regulator with XRE-family HTH domain
VTDARKEFVARLRSERERRGVSLEEIVERTKIKKSLLVALERNDLSGWPNGIYRRSYIRNYASAVGLTPESVAAEFHELFPEDGVVTTAAATSRDSESAFRITLATDVFPSRVMAARRATVAVIEACVLLLIGAVLSAIPGLSFGTAIGIVVLVYYPMTNACFGQTFALRVLNRALLSPARHPPVTTRDTKASPALVPSRLPEGVNHESVPARFVVDEPLQPLCMADENPNGDSHQQVLQ